MERQESLKEVVWVLGTSSAGKKTFINNLVLGQNQALLDRFGWTGKRVVACTESITFPGDINMAEIVKERSRIPEIVSKLVKDADVALIKWQYMDSIKNLPQDLMRMLPQAQHRVIALEVPHDILVHRLNGTDWWPKYYKNTEDAAADERLMMREAINQFGQQFIVTRVGGTESGDYSITG